MLKAGGVERIGKWMGACWFWVSTQNNGGACPHSESTQNNGGACPHSESTQNNGGACPHFVGGLVISSSSSLQLRVDVSKIRSR